MAKQKKAADGSKDYAYILFMQRVQQKEIAKRVGVTENTISGWKIAGNWEAKRTAKTISMDELVTKSLKRIGDLLDSDDFNADSFAKAVAQLKTLKTSNTVDDEIMCFMNFQNFLMDRRIVEKIEEQFLKELTRLQDIYIQNRIGNV